MQEAEEKNFLYAGLLGGFDDVLGSLNVNAVVVLLADLAVDPGAMGDAIAAGECFRQFSGRVGSYCGKRGIR